MTVIRPDNPNPDADTGRPGPTIECTVASSSATRASSKMDYTIRHILAECEAKRRIVEEHLLLIGPAGMGSNALEGILRLLALPFADHPDYDESWRP